MAKVNEINGVYVYEKPKFIDLTDEECSDWDTWLSSVKTKLPTLGYKEYRETQHNQDYTFWKPFYYDDDREYGYQLGVLLYDYRKFIPRGGPDNIGIVYKFTHIGVLDGRVDLDISGLDITLNQFEIIGKDFFLKNVHQIRKFVES